MYMTYVITVKVIVCLRSYILELSRCKNNGVKGLFKEYKIVFRVTLEGANKERTYYLGCSIQIILTHFALLSLRIRER